MHACSSFSAGCCCAGGGGVTHFCCNGNVQLPPPWAPGTNSLLPTLLRRPLSLSLMRTRSAHSPLHAAAPMLETLAMTADTLRHASHTDTRFPPLLTPPPSL